MKDAKLNNLLGIETFSMDKVNKKAKVTKRTEVAKDVLQENAYVLGKDVLKEKLPNKEDHIKTGKGLNNLISLSDFTKAVPATKDHVTKRTSTGKDVLLEKKKAKEDKPCDCEKETKKDKKSDKDCVTAKQKKLPWNKDKEVCK